MRFLFHTNRIGGDVKHLFPNRDAPTLKALERNETNEPYRDFEGKEH